MENLLNFSLSRDAKGSISFVSENAKPAADVKTSEVVQVSEAKEVEENKVADTKTISTGLPSEKVSEENNILLSFCIPTRNRAELCKTLVLELLEIPSNKIEVVVSDNCSDDKTEEYMRAIKDSRFHYYRNAENNGYENNATVISKGNGKFCMLIRDKDTIPNVKEWFARNEKFFEESKETTYFRGDLIQSDGSYRDKAVRGFAKADTAEAYLTATKTSFLSTSLIFPKKIVRKVYEDAKNADAYVWSIYPFFNLIYFCAKYADYVHMKDLIVHFRVPNTPQYLTWDKKAFYGISNESYGTFNSQVRRVEGSIRLLGAIDTAVENKLPATECLLGNHWCWIFWCHYKNSDFFKNKVSPVEYKKNGLTWIYEFWHGLSGMIKENQKFNKISFVRLKFFEQHALYNHEVICKSLASKEREAFQKNVLLSICIPTRNSAHYIYALVQECLKIRSDNIEVVVNDNCSGDKTQSLLTLIWDRRFHYYRNDKVSEAWNNTSDCLDKAHGKFSLLLRENDFIPNIEQWFEEIEPLLMKSDDTTVFRGYLRSADEKTCLADIPKKIYKKGALETYDYVLNGPLWSSAIIYPQKILKQFLTQAKETAPYFGIIYPHLNIMFFCVKYGDLVPMKSLSVKVREKVNNFNVETEKALPIKSDENYGSWKSKKILISDMINLTEFPSLTDIEKIAFLENILLKQCDFIVASFNDTYRLKDTTSLKYRNYGFVYWHYEFWSSFINLLRKINSLYGISTVKLEFLEKIMNKYYTFCKLISEQLDKTVKNFEENSTTIQSSGV